MNFLAHFHLAWPDEGLIAGGLEGDYYKGPLRGDLPTGLEQGVRLHRAIDAFTDSHPRVEMLRREFPPQLRRYAGILLDLSFDHFLTLHWQEFSDLALQDFNRAVYHSLERQQQLLSENSRNMLARLVQHDILGIYHDWETVPASAARIGQRFRRGNPLTAVDRDLIALRGAIEEAFLAFYPELVAFSEQQQAQWNPGVVTQSNIALGNKNP